MLTTTRPKPARRRPAAKPARSRLRKPFKFELTPEDIALDNAISSAAARTLATRRS